LSGGGRLPEADPDAVWEMHEDPKYEWLGQIAISIPPLPLYTAQCDAAGQVVLVWDEVKAALAPGTDPRQAIRTAYGRPQIDALKVFVESSMTARTLRET
jgi:hypothetical protein